MGLSLSDLSEQTGHTKSLVYRVVAELEPRRYVTKLDNGHYTLGPRHPRARRRVRAQMPLMSSVAPGVPVAGDADRGDGQPGGPAR